MGLGRLYVFFRNLFVFAIAFDTVGREAEKPLCEGLWIWRGRDFFPALVCQCGHDDRVAAGHRDTVAIFQLWRFFSLGFHIAAFYFYQDGCPAEEPVTAKNKEALSMKME